MEASEGEARVRLKCAFTKCIGRANLSTRTVAIQLLDD